MKCPCCGLDKPEMSAQEDPKVQWKEKWKDQAFYLLLKGSKMALAEHEKDCKGCQKGSCHKRWVQFLKQGVYKAEHSHEDIYESMSR